MKAIIESGRACGSITVPPSKSIAHRFLICSALSSGKTVIKNLPKCADIEATLDCLISLGVKIETEGKTATVYGLGSGSFANEHTLNCRDSGSTLRFLMPMVLADGVRTNFICDNSLLNRPIEEHEKICKAHGFTFVPIDKGYSVCGKLQTGEFSVSGSVSSQYITGLLFALARIGQGKIRITDSCESRPYIEMTAQILRIFGFSVDFSSDEITINSPNNRIKPDEVTVPGDESGAAFFGVLNHLGGRVNLLGLDGNINQGDRIWRQYSEKISDGFCEIPLSDCPDLAPVLFVLASLKYGAKFTGTKRLKYKESNRAIVMAEELAKCGVALEIGENSVVVSAGAKAPTAMLSSHGDHRIAMALAVLLSVFGGELDISEAVGKSMPEFWELIGSVGINCHLQATGGE